MLYFVSDGWQLRLQTENNQILCHLFMSLFSIFNLPISNTNISVYILDITVNLAFRNNRHSILFHFYHPNNGLILEIRERLFMYKAHSVFKYIQVICVFKRIVLNAGRGFSSGYC